jgi:hypothetical protein
LQADPFLKEARIQKHCWRRPASTPPAGGVSIYRYFRAYDDQTGKLLWETRLTDVPSNAPISYTVNGKQYIAIGVGNGGAQATGFTPLVPEIQNVDRAPAVWVFQLP